MPLWPFKLRRPKTTAAGTTTQQEQQQQQSAMPSKQPLAERSQNLQSSSAVPVPQPTSVSSAARVPQHNRSADVIEKSIRSPPQTSATNKENLVGAHRNDSNENITALPVSRQLNQSPHLRPADSARAEIPYNFRDLHTSAGAAASSLSIHRPDGTISKPGTLRSKRSTFDSKSVKRKSSTKRKEDFLREEEIRAMSAVMPAVPKRPGDGPLRKDTSYKRRTFNSTTDKEASLRAPVPEEPFAEQHGWEVEHLWISTRPAVRLSSIPAYALPSPNEPPMPLPRDITQKLREKEKERGKEPARHVARRRKTVGADADELDSNDIRAVLERDTKRREKRDIERQERLDRKLRETSSRRRASSSKRRKDAEVDLAMEEAPPVPALPRPDVSRVQSSIHPALRDEPVLKEADVFGLGIGPSTAVENPFRDPIAEHRAETERRLEQGPSETASANDAGLENPFEDSVIETAREVRMSTAVTPPLSPVDRNRRSLGRIPLEELTTAIPPATAAVSASAPSSAVVARPEQPRSPISAGTRRSGSEAKDRRGGAWASFFRRASTQKETKSSETSFANTSRESMSRQQLPPHLITERVSPFQRTSTGTPTRTMSKFREDLPDAPISPPDSRVQSPDLPVNAAAIVAAATAAASSPTSATARQQDAGESSANAHAAATVGSTERSDTPLSPVHDTPAMASSMASVDSEGSWLASGGSIKRASQQSGAAKSFGSLRRTPEFNASYEDLGSAGDKDAEYVRSGARRSLNRLSGPAVAGASAEDDAISGGIRSSPSVRDSVGRRPTLIQRDSAIRSREGLLAEYTAGEEQYESSAVKDDSPDDDEDQVGAQLESARSVNYGRSHARQMSAGSAKLLDVAPRRMSASPGTPISPTSHSQLNSEETEEQPEN